MITEQQICNFFKENPKGYLNIIQQDTNFKLTKDISFFVDETSINLINCCFVENKYGHEYSKKGTFMIPFQSIVRIEFIKK